MPWELTIRRADGSPLGHRDSVRHALTAAFPGVQFYREPSGPEKIAASEAAGVAFPEILRRHFEQRPAAEQADFEGDGVSVRFLLGTGPDVSLILVEVRGDAEQALPPLRRLSARTGWVVLEPGGAGPLIG